MTRMTPTTLVSTTPRTCSGVTTLGSWGIPPVMAALLTRTSRPPSASSWAAARRRSCRQSRQGHPNTSSPSACSLSTASSRRPACGADADGNPRRANNGDLVTDAHLLAPVTSAVLVLLSCVVSGVLSGVPRSCPRRRALPRPGQVGVPPPVSPQVNTYPRRGGDPRAALLRRRRRGARQARRPAPGDGPAAAVARDRPAHDDAWAPTCSSVRRGAASPTPVRRSCVRQGRARWWKRPSGGPAAPSGRPGVPRWCSPPRPVRRAEELMASCSTPTPPGPTPSTSVVLSPPGHRAAMLRDGRAGRRDPAPALRRHQRVRRRRADGRGGAILPAGHP